MALQKLLRQQRKSLRRAILRREGPFVMVDHAVVVSGQLSVREPAVYLVLCAYLEHEAMRGRQSLKIL